MSEKIQNSPNQEKSKIKSQMNLDISNLNNYIDSNIISSLNLSKEQLFQSFILFQNFLTMNKNQINEINNLKNKKEEEIMPKEQKDNNSKLGEKENKKMNNDLKVNIYDEMPIKSSGYNFEELLEKTLANEEMLKRMEIFDSIKI